MQKGRRCHTWIHCVAAFAVSNGIVRIGIRVNIPVNRFVVVAVACASP